MTSRDREATWRELLPAPARDGRRLALGVELRQRVSRADAHWGPRPWQSVTPRALAARQDDLALALRPLVRGASGAWVKSEVSWDAVRRSPERYDAAHARWFTELHSIVHDARATGPFASESEWLLLDATRSALVWPHLADAERLGIPVVAVSKHQSVRMAQRATVVVDVAPADGGGLRLTPIVELDGEPADAGMVRPLAAGGLYAFTVDHDPIALTLSPAALPAPLGALLAAGRIDVPAAEASEFLATAYPHLARRAQVRARPGVALPDPRTPQLQVSVAFTDTGGGYRIVWRYPGLEAIAYDDRLAHADDRDPEAEARWAALVESAWTDAAVLPFAGEASLDVDEADVFAASVLPALERLDGVRVEVTGMRPSPRELDATPHLRITTVESADPDWFDLGILVTIDGRTIPYGPLVTALARGRRRMRLSDGAWFSLAHPALAQLKVLLEEAAELDEWETGPRIHRDQLALWADFEDLADEAEPAVSWRAAVRALAGVDGVSPHPLPRSLRAELRPYQRAGYDWLMFLWQHRLGGILADDMGLGKTLQTLAFLRAARADADGAFLVVAPTSVLSAWQEQAARFVPDLRVAVVATTEASSGVAVAEHAGGADVVLTSYAVLRLDDGAFAAVEWAGVVLDEAQFVKNPATRVHRAVKALRARTVVALTGTPMENTLEDLWALLSLTAPGLFPSARRFRDEYVQPIEKGRVPDSAGGSAYRAARLARLRARIRPLVLRRTKEQVAPELPPKQEQDVAVELTPAHRALYETVLHRERQKILGLLDDLDRQRFIVFRSLTLLRLMSLAPVLVDEQHRSVGSAKLDALVDRLGELAAEGHRALVFSQFTSFLDLVAERVEAAGLAWARLDGSTPRRGEVIDGFRSGDAPVFLISLKAGGFGLTLTEADYVFLMDPWWSPAAEAQAIDRTHRIGQDRHVFVYRMLAADTIEQKVRALQERKSRLFSAVLDDDEALARALTADDIRGLLDADESRPVSGSSR